MQKSVLTTAVTLALASLAAGTAFAQSSLTLYGNLDVAVDSASKGAGKIAGTVWSLNPAAAAAVGAESHVVRVAPSLSSVNAIGVRGVEDIGGGYKGSFVLEGQMAPDTGAQSGQDSRMWGRQAFVGLTTPVGEFRLGRQYAPMFYTFAATTVESLGGADLQSAGLVVNNLQVRQDNQVSYWLRSGPLTAAISYSPQAGVADKISSVRAPSSTAATGQIVGGSSAGTEAAGTEGRGRTVGLFANYQVMPELLLSGAYHQNKFGNAVAGSYNASTATFTGLFNLDKYTGYALAAKYTVAGVGTQLSGIFHGGKYSMDDGSDIKVNTIGLGVKHPIGNFSIGAQAALAKFTNFTKGKDTAVMLIGDYNFSKRTRLYARFGFTKDDAGNEANTNNAALNAAGFGVNGGPLPALTGFGALETPFFSGAGANVGNTTRLFAVGIRHQF